jgi:hypothetical protein
MANLARGLASDNRAAHDFAGDHGSIPVSFREITVVSTKAPLRLRSG